jgi:hypothetical protein
MQPITLENYPAYRDLTRELGDHIRQRVNDYIALVQGQFRPGSVFGPHVGSKESPKNAFVTYTEFTAFFREIAVSADLDPNLPDTIEITSARPVIAPLVYEQQIAISDAEKRLTVTSPIRFVLAYPEFPFPDLRALALSREPINKLRDAVLTYAVLNFIVSRNKPLQRLFEDLSLPIRSERLAELGPVPITTITPAAATLLAPAPIIAQVCKFSGADTAEELVDFAAWNSLPGHLGDWFRETAAKYLTPAVAASSEPAAAG